MTHKITLANGSTAHAELNRTIVTATDGGYIQTQSVEAILLLNILIELQQANIMHNLEIQHRIANGG